MFLVLNGIFKKNLLDLSGLLARVDTVFTEGPHDYFSMAKLSFDELIDHFLLIGAVVASFSLGKPPLRSCGSELALGLLAHRIKCAN